jgi:hypothetical protein
MLSNVLYPFLNPVCDSEIKPTSFDNSHNMSFRSDIGVRQWENLSPFFFTIYLNDLEQFFVENKVNDLENIRNMCSENLNIFVRLFSLLHADDTIILSETEADNIKLCELDPSI